MDSIRKKLFLLPDDTDVFPGHMGMTSIGFEKEQAVLLYRCSVYGTDKINQYEELIKAFLQPGEYEISGVAEVPDDLPAKVSAEAPAKDPAGDTEKKTFFGVLQQAVAKIAEVAEQSVQDMATVCIFDGDKDAVKRQYLPGSEGAYRKAAQVGDTHRGSVPSKWQENWFKRQEVQRWQDKSCSRTISCRRKRQIWSCEIYRYQQRTTGAAKDNSLSLYLGIPFRPTRRRYCSFTSNQVKKPEIDRYLEALFHEIAFAAENIKEDGYEIESLYIGGGTPTTLDEAALEAFWQEIQEHFDLSHLREFTVEAGRPDTITEGTTAYHGTLRCGSYQHQSADHEAGHPGSYRACPYGG